MIPVTKSFLPPIENYMQQVQRAYANEWLTNRGELVKELEQALKSRFQLESYIPLATNNGTIPLQIGLKLLGKGAEIITTPFSYVATTASIVWENCTPVFVDIHPDYLTIDETKIERAITPNTTCILATHVFGNPCNVAVIQKIADKHNLAIIYDGAHCFNVKFEGKSIFEYGDLTTCSFHATKLFHTGEGGAIFCKNMELYNKVFFSHNFGHISPSTFHGLGINAKLSELQAAMGLAVLPYMDYILEKRGNIVALYNKLLDFTNVRKIKIRENTSWNSSYYPVIFQSESTLLLVEKKLNERNIFPRRYFYPSLNTLNYTKGDNVDISERIANTILCLPIYDSLTEGEVNQISEIVNKYAL
jgi:dTDP-4-amino-4,6-dideoxygalactose transaminase